MRIYQNIICGSFIHQLLDARNLRKIAREHGLKKVIFQPELKSDDGKISLSYRYNLDTIVANFSGHRDGPHTQFSGLAVRLESSPSEAFDEALESEVKSYIESKTREGYSKVFYGPIDRGF